MNVNIEMDRPYFNNSDSVLVTTNYYYNSRECIGQGATSCVYKGQHRVTGEEMALKVSKQIGLHREVEREIEAFLVLRHKNIVSFYGIEEDVQSGNHVIVMEYCSGGSLYSYLQEPENKRGLPDSEFLILLKHLRRAIEKLNSCGYIHRDIKPGNVLRALDQTGKSIYKISDFGSARQLESDDHCVSLAGTEEYLHPHVYDKAFINRSPMIIYKHSMDRWSLGATLCHAATGDVPFKPCGGARKNRAVMFQMVSKKPSGKIRCIQEKTNGKITWFDDLPMDCNMTEGLRARVVPVIAGLMEKDERRQWTSTTFIHEVDRILRSVRISILNTDTCNYHTLYMDPENTFAYISENVAAQTEIPSARQTYFIDNRPKDCMVSSSVRVKELPSTSEENPLVCVFLTDNDESKFNQYVQKCTFPDVFILSEDCKVSAEMSIIIYDILKKVTESVQAQKALTHFAKEYRSYMEKLVETIETDYRKDVMILTEKLTRFRQITETVSMSGMTKDSSINEKYQYLSNKEIEMKKIIEFIKCEIVDIKRLQQSNRENEHFLQLKLCSNECISEIEYVFQQSKDVVKSMCKRRKNSYFTHMEEVRHKNDKKKMISYFDSASRHWKNCCNTKSQKLTESFKKWMRYQHKIQEKLDNAREHIIYLQSLSRSFNNELTTFSAYSGREWSMMVSSEKWKSLLRQKDDSAVVLIGEGRNLMKSLSLVLKNSCLEKIGDVVQPDLIQGTFSST